MKIARLLSILLVLIMTCTAIMTSCTLLPVDEVKDSDKGNGEEELKASEGLSYAKVEAKEEYSVNGIGTCKDKVIVVPEEHKGLPVTEIANEAFKGNADITAVKLPDTIQKVGDKAFSDCANLGEVSLPDDTEIGQDVFRGSVNVDIKKKHKFEKIKATEPSCEVPGNIECWYCAECNEYYYDNKGHERCYDPFISASHNFDGGTCSECGEVLDSINIIRVDEVPDLGKFALGTLENAIGLPEFVNVYTADGKTHQLAVAWELTDYDKSKAGEYVIRGHILAGEFCFAEGVSSELEAHIEIVEFMKGTADIVFVLDISGSMGDEVNNVKNNIVAFAQAIEDAGVSARWGAITYSDYCEYPTTPNEQTQIIMNGASDWYVSAEEYKSAINNIVLANGGDTPETGIDGLLLANTMTNRKDARVFYILLTDAETKIDNHYGVDSMQGCADVLDADGVNVSVIASTGLYSHYAPLYNTTGGIVTDIYSNFSQALLDNLIPIIYQEVIN